VTFPIWAAAGPTIIGASAGLGSGIGGLIGTIFEARGGSMKPDADAEGAHTTVVRGADGEVKKYQDWEPNEPRDPTDPNRFNPGKRCDKNGPAHRNVRSRNYVAFFL
jgi:hypothetical protein